MRHFTSTEAERYFGFVAIFEEAYQVAQFYLIIAFISSRSEFDFLDLNLFLLLLLLFLRLALLIEEFAEIHDPANRWLGIRADLDQIHTSFQRAIQRLFNRYYADGLTINTNETNFLATDLTIQAGAGRLLARFFSAVYSLFLQTLLTTGCDLIAQGGNQISYLELAEIGPLTGTHCNFTCFDLFIAAN